MLTEHIDANHAELDLLDNKHILDLLLSSQQQAVNAVHAANDIVAIAVDAAAKRLSQNETSRLVLVGAGASGRLAVQDGAELWPTYGWPFERLLLRIAGGEDALLQSVEGVEDDPQDAIEEVNQFNINAQDVVLGLAASGRSKWTCAWIEAARAQGALTIGFANNNDTPLLALAEHAVFLDSGAEVLAGSTRMSAGTAQKIVLNLFSTLLMIRLNRTHGNLMVDMAARNSKLDDRRIRMMQTVLPDISVEQAKTALASANGWVKLAVLVSRGLEPDVARQRLKDNNGSLRLSLSQLP